MPAPLLRAGSGRAARWAVVGVGTALLVASVLLGLPPAGASARPSAARLLARADASAALAYSGTAVSTASLGLPDLPRLKGVASLFGSTTRTRVWWASAATWRVDELTATGEHGTYLTDGVETTWDYEDDDIATGPASPGARLPDAGDLEPPQAARDLLAGPGGVAGAARGAVLLGARRVAGRTADGVRVTAGAAGSTLSHADVWVDRTSGLPLEVDLLDTTGSPSLVTRFDAVHLGRPPASALTPPSAPGAQRSRPSTDVIAGVDGYAPWRLPATLAGLPALQDPAGTGAADGAGGRAPGVLAYGTGLARVALVPLTTTLGHQAVTAARAAGGTDLAGTGANGAPTASADAVLVRSGALSAAFLDDARGRSWIVAGTVTPAVLSRAVGQLVDDPPAWRRSR